MDRRRLLLNQNRKTERVIQNLFNKDSTPTNLYINDRGDVSIDTENSRFIITNCKASIISMKASNYAGTPYVRISEYDSNNTFIKRTLFNNEEIKTGAIFTPTANATRLDIRTNTPLYNINGFTDLQIEYGNIQHTYTPYNVILGTTTKVDNTLVYGYYKGIKLGAYDTLNLDTKIKTIGGLEVDLSNRTWIKNTTNTFYTRLTNNADSDYTTNMVLSNDYTLTTSYASLLASNKTFAMASNAHTFYIHDTSFENATDVNLSGVLLYYKLATPTTKQMYF